MIRTSKHKITFANANKQRKLHLFLDEYSRVVKIYIDYLWNNKHVWNDKRGNAKILDIKNKQYECPTFISVDKELNIDTNFSARATKCCSTQACGIVKAILEKPRKRLYILNEQKKTGRINRKLQKKVLNQKITKPEVKSVNPELNSICCDFCKVDSKEFDGFFQLKSIGKFFGKIRIPIKFHRQAIKLMNKGNLMNSFLISSDNIEFRWDIEALEKKKNGIIVGADQGLKTVVTFSNGETTQLRNNHDYSLEDVLGIMARKIRGSKAFRKASEHRKNIIHWSINQLNLQDKRQVNLENVFNIGYKNRTSRKLQHWPSALIKNKLQARCEELGVQCNLQSSTYRSQRCSKCGWVRRKNRSGKLFLCTNCGFECDADLNAAKNHEIDLPEIYSDLRSQKLNIQGFFWKSNGLFTFDGAEFIVPLSNNQN